jgi:poly(A) polymerase
MAALDPEMRPGITDLAAKEALYRLGRDAFQDRVLIAWARAAAVAEDEAWLTLFGLPARWAAPAFPVKGDHLIARGATPGPDLGKTLRMLEAEWIASDFKLSRSALLKKLAG